MCVLHALIFAQAIRKRRKPQIAFATVARARESLLNRNVVDTACEHGAKATENLFNSLGGGGKGKVKSAQQKRGGYSQRAWNKGHGKARHQSYSG